MDCWEGSRAGAAATRTIHARNLAPLYRPLPALQRPPSIPFALSSRRFHPLLFAVSELTPVNGRDKVICVNKLEANQVANKVELLLNASGAKLKPLKNATLEAGPGNEAARGIWSALHDAAKPAGGYRI